MGKHHRPVWSPVSPGMLPGPQAGAQTSLAVSQPGDLHEQEADHIADQVMRMPESAASGAPRCSCSGSANQDGACSACRASRLAEQGTSAAVAGIHAPASVYETISAPGEPLDAQTRAFMEPRFGHDFSRVRVHTGARAADSAAALRARAYTVGTHIVLGANEGAQSSSAGRHLLAHELTHTLQQASSTAPRMLQRSPFAGIEHDTETIHERLGQQYAGEGGPSLGAVQYTPGYAQWLRSQTANNVRFKKPPSFVQANPLDRLRLNQSAGFTTLIVNGRRIDGPDLATNISLLETQLRPANVVHAPGLVTGQISCRFAPQFGIETSTEVIEATPPTAKGWQARLPAAALNNPRDCAGKASIPVTLRGHPSDQAYEQLIHDSEMEHVSALEQLHNRHFVPYYNFIKNLSATAGTEADCEAALRRRINDRDKQAAFAFSLADIAETRRFDAPGSTHQGNMVPSIAANCSSVTLTASQMNPQQPGADPGNVQKVAPQVQAVNPGNLTVNGSTLMDGATIIRRFNSPADAATAMGMMVTYGITEIQRIGPFEMLLSNGQPPSGPLAGISGLDIDPDAYQVTIGFPNANDWVISQMAGVQFFSIVDFGAQRDQAYSAVELMRRHRFVRKSWIGPDAAPQMTYFTV